MTNLPIIDIPDPRCQSIVHGPARLLNRPSRPPEEWVGAWCAVRCGGRDENEWLRAFQGIGKWSDYSIPPRELSPGEQYHGEIFHEPEPMAARHHPGCVIGVVRVAGFAVAKSGIECHRRLDEHRDIADPVHDDPWWTDDTDCAWLLSDPKPIDPVEAEGEIIELSEVAWTEGDIRDAEKRAEKWDELFDSEATP